MAERKDGTKRQKVERPKLPVEFCLSLTIEEAAERTGRPESTIRNMMKKGILSIDNGRLVMMGTGKKNGSVNIGRKGLDYLAGEKIPYVDYDALTEIILRKARERGMI